MTFHPVACSEQKPWKLETNSQECCRLSRAQAASEYMTLPGKVGAAIGDSFQVKKAVVFCKNCHQQRNAETQETRHRDNRPLFRTLYVIIDNTA